MDYRKMLHAHEDHQADVTMATIEVPLEDGTRFGIVAVDADRRVVGFQEKPMHPAPMPGLPHLTLASMGIYVFNMDVLGKALDADAADPDSHHDFGKNILPRLIGPGRVYAYPFYDENKKTAKYWRDIGTLDAYYEANMDLCHVNPDFNLYDPEWPLRTHQPQAPPAKFVFADERRMGTAMDSVISPGCIVSGSQIRGCILCPNVRVHSFAVIENSILMPGVQVGRHARIRNAIVDRDVLVPRGAVIGHDLAEDRRRHTVTERGIVVVTVDEDALVAPIDEDALSIEAGVDKA
jgi:glucose-1-phosphate adenylyltransferase